MRINYFTLGFLLNTVISGVMKDASNGYTPYTVAILTGVILLTVLCEVVPRKKGTK